MRTCILLPIMVVFRGCNPLETMRDPVPNTGLIAESEIPEAVKAAVLAAKPNAQIVDAVVTGLGRDMELVSYDVQVKDEDGSQWVIGVSPGGKVTFSLCIDEILENAEQDR